MVSRRRTDRGAALTLASVFTAEFLVRAEFWAYRDLEHARWRAVVPVQPGKKQQIAIQADELAVSATVK